LAIELHSNLLSYLKQKKEGGGKMGFGLIGLAGYGRKKFFKK
jgi:hypothetical protein